MYISVIKRLVLQDMRTIPNGGIILNNSEPDIEYVCVFFRKQDKVSKFHKNMLKFQRRRV